MSYLLMVMEPRGQRATREPAEARRLYDEMMDFAESLGNRGLLLGAESLRTDDHAIRVSTAGGKAQLRDGPFAEAKEMIGGFFLVDVATREEALALARECPAAQWAAVEVRECAPCFA